MKNLPRSPHRFAGMLAIVLFLPLPLLFGCPFKQEEFKRLCTEDKHCANGALDGGPDNPCIDDVCNNGLCENPPKPKGTGCGPAKADVCDGDGNCIECLKSSDC